MQLASILLQCYPPPLSAAASGLFMLFLWVSRLQAPPQLSRPFLIALLPVALFHTIGHVSACVSFGQMAVSFAHIVKSAEPVRIHSALHTTRCQ
jgi:solute carrier family 35 protein E1